MHDNIEQTHLACFMKMPSIYPAVTRAFKKYLTVACFQGSQADANILLLCLCHPIPDSKNCLTQTCQTWKVFMEVQSQPKERFYVCLTK